jgi:hypothetical protein
LGSAGAKTGGYQAPVDQTAQPPVFDATFDERAPPAPTEGKCENIIDIIVIIFSYRFEGWRRQRECDVRAK